MMTPLMCMRCDGRWLGDSHRCPPTPAETERELEMAVVEAAIELTQRVRPTEFITMIGQLGAAVEALQALREAR